MKNLVFFLVLLLSNFVNGQNLLVVNEQILPDSIDNIEFFPPAVKQQNVPDCTHMALIRNLKSSIYNREYHRNPQLAENQFSHTFVWNQNIIPEYEMSTVDQGFYFMKYQGCATIKDFAANEQSTELKPSIEIREKALKYRSKRLFDGNFSVETSFKDKNGVTKRLNSLKDSLSKGKCFTLAVFLYNSFFFEMNENNRMYSYYSNADSETHRIPHVVTVVGYNDRIGHGGAFKVLDASTDRITDGIFYLDFNWFYAFNQDFQYYFLEEDFSAPATTTVLHLSISSGLIPDDIFNGRYIFADTLLSFWRVFETRVIDFQHFFDYAYNRNQFQVTSINGNRIKLRSNQLFAPANNSEGNYEIVKDLTEIDNLKSLSVTVFDPISAEYIGEAGQTIYSYSDRAANCQVNSATIHFLETNKNVQAQVTELSDTTIVVNNFYSELSLLYWNAAWSNPGFVKTCTSVLKRTLITFTIEEPATLVITNPPSTLNALTNKTLSYSFEVQNNDGPVTFSFLNKPAEASITSDGKLTFKSAKIGTYRFTVIASNSKATDSCPVAVKVELGTATEDIEIPEGSFDVFPNPLSYVANIKFALPKRGTVNIGIYNSVGQSIGNIVNQTYEAGEQTLEYDASSLRSGVYIFCLKSGAFSKSIKIVKQ
ncbi:MAG: T9SS type A sorting domain-containing protein [Patescibacteria group bacterium]